MGPFTDDAAAARRVLALPVLSHARVTVLLLHLSLDPLSAVRWQRCCPQIPGGQDNIHPILVPPLGGLLDEEDQEFPLLFQVSTLAAAEGTTRRACAAVSALRGSVGVVAVEFLPERFYNAVREGFEDIALVAATRDDGRAVSHGCIQDTHATALRLRRFGATVARSSPARPRRIRRPLMVR